MYGSLSSDASELVHDFTRCVKPDGSAYGTAGQCRKGTPVEITRIETGLFAIRDGEGRSIGMIQAPGALQGGGGIRGKGSVSSYDVRLTTPDGKNHRVDRIPTLAAAKAKVRQLMGEKAKGGDARAIAQGGLTAKGKASRMRNVKANLVEAEEDFESARDSYLSLKKTLGEEGVKRDRRAQDLLKRAKATKEKWNKLKEELDALEQTKVVG